MGLWISKVLIDYFEIDHLRVCEVCGDKLEHTPLAIICNGCGDIILDKNDLNTKLKKAKDFLMKGNKVKITCSFRGREMLHIDLGEKVMQQMCNELQEDSIVEVPPKRMGRMITLVLAPGTKKVK